MYLEKIDNIIDIIKNPENYPIELVGNAYLRIKKLNSEIYEAKKILENYIVCDMTKEDASKMIIKNNDEELEFNLKIITECDIKNVDKILENNGINPENIGKYEYKISLQKCKKFMKFGGEQKTFLENLFKKRKILEIIKKNA